MRLLEGMIAGLFVAWLLAGFNVDGMLLEVVQPFIEIELTRSHYYIIFALIGLVGSLFTKEV